MSHSQIRRDLHNRIDDRLHKWVKDSCQLYEMADLLPSEAVEDMLISLFTALCAFAAAYELDPDEVILHFRRALAISMRKHEESRS
jgi:hypothetical protein